MTQNDDACRPGRSRHGRGGRPPRSLGVMRWGKEAAAPPRGYYLLFPVSRSSLLSLFHLSKYEMSGCPKPKSWEVEMGQERRKEGRTCRGIGSQEASVVSGRAGRAAAAGYTASTREGSCKVRIGGDPIGTTDSVLPLHWASLAATGRLRDRCATERLLTMRLIARPHGETVVFLGTNEKQSERCAV